MYLLQLIRECKEGLYGAVMMKQYYQDMVLAVMSTEDHEQTKLGLESFDEDMKHMMEVMWTAFTLFTFNRPVYWPSNVLCHMNTTDWYTGNCNFQFKIVLTHSCPLCGATCYILCSRLMNKLFNYAYFGLSLKRNVSDISLLFVILAAHCTLANSLYAIHCDTVHDV